MQVWLPWVVTLSSFLVNPLSKLNDQSLRDEEFFYLIFVLFVDLFLPSQGIFLLVAIIMFLLSDPAERSHLSIITSTLGISVVLCSTVIIPADIYNTSHSDLQSVSSRAEVIKIFYYGAILPFTYTRLYQYFKSHMFCVVQYFSPWSFSLLLSFLPSPSFTLIPCW